jgi:hypothetical protein
MIKALLQRKITIVIGVILVLGIAWYVLSSSGGSAPQTLSTEDSGGDQELRQSLQTLRTIKLDAAIFTDPIYLSLQDFSTQIVDEPVGRTDPFAPLPIAPTAQTTQTARIFKSR